MNFNIPLLKTIRILLFPVSLVYVLVVWLRNKLYDKGILKSASFNLPLICVGNIAVGGTGKSPMVEYLAKLLRNDFQVATLSRGYKRKTKGYALANASTTALDIGDEPMQFHLKFPDVAVAVGEERIVAIPQLLHDKPDTDLIILDDAFQHRAVTAGFNIVLTDCSNLYTRDWYLPSGDLRDVKSSVERADVIIVTKCPADLSVEKKNEIIKELAPAKDQKIFFSTIRYGALYHITEKTPFELNEETEALLVTGIANPKPLKKLLAEQTKSYTEQAYNDHYIFTIDDLKDIQKKFAALNADHKIILTTEKDAVRLAKFEDQLKNLPFYVIPIEMQFLFNEGNDFNNLIITFIRANKKNYEL